MRVRARQVKRWIRTEHDVDGEDIEHPQLRVAKEEIVEKDGDLQHTNT